MNIFRIESTTDEAIENIKSDIISSDCHDNNDINVSLKGRMHNNTGFVLTVSNLEDLNDGVIQNWTKLVEKRGYTCDMRYDFHNGWVDIRCHSPKQSRKYLSVVVLKQMGYLSLMFFSIYMLWQKHNLPLE